MKGETEGIAASASAAAGEIVNTSMRGTNPGGLQPEVTDAPSSLTVLYSDEDIVVLDKPSGVRTVPGKAAAGPDATMAQVTKCAM